MIILYKGSMLTTLDCTHSNLNGKNFASVLFLNSWEIIPYIFEIFAKGEYTFTKKEKRFIDENHMCPEWNSCQLLLAALCLLPSLQEHKVEIHCVE